MNQLAVSQSLIYHQPKHEFYLYVKTLANKTHGNGRHNCHRGLLINNHSVWLDLHNSVQRGTEATSQMKPSICYD